MGPWVWRRGLTEAVSLASPFSVKQEARSRSASEEGREMEARGEGLSRRAGQGVDQGNILGFQAAGRARWRSASEFKVGISQAQLGGEPGKD